MINRVPRKKKKIAKKAKARADAVVMVTSAMISAQSVAQVTIVNALPCELPALKVLRVVEIVVNTAAAISSNMQNIKHWTAFVPNYKTV